MTDLSLDDIRVLKLTTGEIVIGFYRANTSEDLSANPDLDNYLVLQEPYEVEYEVHPEDVGGPTYAISACQYMPFILDNSLLMQKCNIIALGSPDENLINLYTDLLENQGATDELTEN